MESKCGVGEWPSQYRVPHSNDYWATKKLVSVAYGPEYIGFAGIALQDFFPALEDKKNKYVCRFYGGISDQQRNIEEYDNFALFMVLSDSELLESLVSPVDASIPFLFKLPDRFWRKSGEWEGVAGAKQLLEMHDNVFGACELSQDGAQLVAGAVGEAIVRLCSKSDVLDAVREGANELMGNGFSFVASVLRDSVIEFANVKGTAWNRLSGKYKKLGEISLTQSNAKFVQMF